MADDLYKDFARRLGTSRAEAKARAYARATGMDREDRPEPPPRVEVLGPDDWVPANLKDVTPRSRGDRK